MEAWERQRVIAAGGNHSLALKDDSSIVSWGRDDYNQVSGTPTTSDFAQVAGGSDNSLALKSDGSLVALSLIHI